MLTCGILIRWNNNVTNLGLILRCVDAVARVRSHYHETLTNHFTGTLLHIICDVSVRVVRLRSSAVRQVRPPQHPKRFWRVPSGASGAANIALESRPAPRAYAHLPARPSAEAFFHSSFSISPHLLISCIKL